MPTRAGLADVLIGLSDTLAPGFDPGDYLRALAGHCAAFADADAVGVLLADGDGVLHAPGLPAPTALRDQQAAQGPAVRAYVTAADESGPVTRWPGFAPTATAAGFRHVHAIPMRLRGTAVGAVCLYRADERPFTGEEIAAARALADMAAVGLSAERTVRHRQALADQLQAALDSRVVIEQAKGVLAERRGVRVADGFRELRRLARDHNLKIAQVAEEVVRSALLHTPG
ncbi:ANTAR domain-containing protein [Actinokineospora enzanensis]|uniref:ANTAR domain-containing protein n=1 Tax=Actinokineospora enzanensis TaxID=155975 RepID=UPI0003795553|nr:GAF and ANTAR domain-containing protein [Actinokineospora enzanensis]